VSEWVGMRKKLNLNARWWERRRRSGEKWEGGRQGGREGGKEAGREGRGGGGREGRTELEFLLVLL